ncbi:hypothetical protein LPYR103PRE_24470 [Segatella asaccharophila]
MLSTTDFEKLLFLYKTEGKNMSIQTFCVNSGVNYRAFDKWFRNTHKDIVPVEVLDRPKEEIRENKESVEEQPGSQETFITLSMNFSNGMYLKRSGLSYPELKQFILKLEGLC